MISALCRALAPAAVALVAALPAFAQQNPVCTRLEAQLAAFDRGGGGDPARNDQIRRFEEAANSQQAELDRQRAAARRMGCEGNSFFVLFSGQPAQCAPLNAKIRQMQGNLERIESDLSRLRGAQDPGRSGQRHAILTALAQNNCGPQYRQAAAQSQPRGLFDSLFGPGSIFSGGGSAPWSSGGDGYRTVCVRLCDGYFYPISFATNQSRFQDDERTCQRSCPAAEVILFSHRNPGEDIGQAVSNSGQLYSALPNAFRYRQAFDASCSCKGAGQTWAQALKHIDDDTVERGDIVVNEERARQMSQPRVDAQGRPIRPDPRAAQQRPAQSAVQTAPAPAATPASGEAPPPPREAQTVKPDPNRKIREVGPTFIPSGR
ncbi:MAG: DUF2865 domain-containing protein [Alphaproteobacteria bacterium]|nr:DUF2865 domain-containing protein [Alphaproteobacteria bacterium]